MTLEQIMGMIDLSCVQGCNTLAEIDEMVGFAYEHKPKCLFTLPAFTPYLAQKLEEKGRRGILLGGTMGFPSGGELTEVKVLTAQRMLEAGCDEFDMVINIGALKSGLYDFVLNDIRSVVEAVPGHTTKCILEVTRLTDDEIKRGCELAVKAGITFVKSGTGWMPNPTTVEHIKLMKSVVGNAAQIKAAGGIRNIDTIAKMTEAGCTRFGIGLQSCKKIAEEAVKNAKL
ncbi:MAG: deoxyribose-phosphate aldolase [Clostridia bacterium]|nr:deoxyribose-phosphate aldolase [Clostridia bacterium]